MDDQVPSAILVTSLEQFSVMVWPVNALRRKMEAVSDIQPVRYPFLIRDHIVVSAQGFCHEMKVIQAFSWALFGMNVLALFILYRLVNLAQMYGRFDIWQEPIRGELLGRSPATWSR